MATRVTVFRDSKYIGCWDVDKISNQKLIGAMVGRELTQMYPSKKARIGDTVLRINNISKEGYFKQVSFDVKKGEILGLTMVWWGWAYRGMPEYLRNYDSG